MLLTCHFYRALRNTSIYQCVHFARESVRATVRRRQRVRLTFQISVFTMLGGDEPCSISDHNSYTRQQTDVIIHARHTSDRYAHTDLRDKLLLLLSQLCHTPQPSAAEHRPKPLPPQRAHPSTKSKLSQSIWLQPRRQVDPASRVGVYPLSTDIRLHRTPSPPRPEHFRDILMAAASLILGPHSQCAYRQDVRHRHAYDISP